MIIAMLVSALVLAALTFVVGREVEREIWERRHAKLKAKFDECRALLDAAHRNNRTLRTRAKKARRELRRMPPPFAPERELINTLEGQGRLLPGPGHPGGGRKGD